MSGERPRPCARCGLMKKGRGNVALCRDCRYTMSREEQALWRDDAVELSHRKEAA